MDEGLGPVENLRRLEIECCATCKYWHGLLPSKKRVRCMRPGGPVWWIESLDATRHICDGYERGELWAGVVQVEA